MMRFYRFLLKAYPREFRVRFEGGDRIRGDLWASPACVEGSTHGIAEVRLESEAGYHGLIAGYHGLENGHHGSRR